MRNTTNRNTASPKTIIVIGSSGGSSLRVGPYSTPTIRTHTHIPRTSNTKKLSINMKK
jgi:hypothetical protein